MKSTPNAQSINQQNRRKSYMNKRSASVCVCANNTVCIGHNVVKHATTAQKQHTK